MTATTYNVPDISCEHCRRTINDAVAPLPGVAQVDIDLDAKTVAVTGGDPATVRVAIAAAGDAVA